jgi:hypothetical protein
MDGIEECRRGLSKNSSRQAGKPTGLCALLSLDVYLVPVLFVPLHSVLGYGGGGGGVGSDGSDGSARASSSGRLVHLCKCCGQRQAPKLQRREEKKKSPTPS